MFTVRKRCSAHNKLMAMPKDARKLAILIDILLDKDPSATLLVSRSTDDDKAEMGLPYDMPKKEKA